MHPLEVFTLLLGQKGKLAAAINMSIDKKELRGFDIYWGNNGAKCCISCDKQPDKQWQ